MKSALALTDKLEKLAVEKPVLDREAMNGAQRGRISYDSLGQAGIAVRSPFTEWTEDGHIRHPSFQGLRENKKAAEVKMEKPQAVRSDDLCERQLRPVALRYVEAAPLLPPAGGGRPGVRRTTAAR